MCPIYMQREVANKRERGLYSCYIQYRETMVKADYSVGRLLQPRQIEKRTERINLSLSREALPRQPATVRLLSVNNSTSPSQAFVCIFLDDILWSFYFGRGFCRFQSDSVALSAAENHHKVRSDFLSSLE